MRRFFSFLPGILFMPVNECIPMFEGAYASKISVKAAAALTGKRFVAVSATFEGTGSPGLATDATPGLIRVNAPAAGAKPLGILGYDLASGAIGHVISGDGLVAPVLSGAAVAVGVELEVDASGRVITFASGQKVGRALSAVGGADLEVWVRLYG